MEEGWVLVYQADEEYKAEIIKQLLESSELHPVVMDRKDDEFRIGNVEVYVSPLEADAAVSLIRANSEPDS
jgi:3-dehydroquinate synthase class II